MKDMDFTDYKKTSITTKIAAIFICVAVTVSMLTAAPVRAAENEDAADQTQTTQTVQSQEAEENEAAEENTQATDVQTADEQKTTDVQTTTVEQKTTAQEQKETTASNDSNVQTPAAKATSKPKQKAKSKKKSKEIVAPDEVDNVLATAAGRGKTIIKWTPVKDADGYYIYRSSKKSGNYKRIAKLKGEKRSKYINRYKKLRKNKRYFYKVYAYKRVNGENIMSESADKDSAKNTLSYKEQYTMKATAYSGGGLCANGKACKVGRVAVDPDVIPLGTWLYVKGYGFCQACDTGGAIQGNRIDLYYNTESKCNAYGVRYTKVYVLRK